MEVGAVSCRWVVQGKKANEFLPGFSPRRNDSLVLLWYGLGSAKGHAALNCERLGLANRTP
jgi:hypothetical protein